jgi:hypothetical protein
LVRDQDDYGSLERTPCEEFGRRPMGNSF